LQHATHHQRHPRFIGAIFIRRRGFALTPQFLHASADCCEIIGGARFRHIVSPVRFFGFCRWQDWLIVVAGASGGIKSWIGRLTDRHPQRSAC
jgi:hypothetical protein